MPKAEKKQNSPLIIGLIIIVIIALAGLFYFQKNKQKNKKPAITAENSWNNPPAPEPQENKLADSAADTEEQEAAPPRIETEEKLKKAPVAADTQSPLQAAMLKLDRFFIHLDNQPYFQAYNISGGAKTFFHDIADKLSANPPSVNRETDNLFTILQNTAHFYRVLGKKNMKILLDILSHEQEIMEPTMACFYQWSLVDDLSKPDYPHFSLETLYSYSGFFLNTLGGQSYLFRRKTKTRLLTKYYCILILDRANDENLNQFGIDIKYPLIALIDEMEAFQELKNSDYLRRLDKLQDKYDI